MYLTLYLPLPSVFLGLTSDLDFFWINLFLRIIQNNQSPLITMEPQVDSHDHSLARWRVCPLD